MALSAMYSSNGGFHHPASVMESGRGEFHTIRPAECPGINEQSAEVGFGAQWFEQGAGALQKGMAVEDTLLPVRKNQRNLEAVQAFGFEQLNHPDRLLETVRANYALSLSGSANRTEP
jgi:hypothetical protein